MNEVEVFERLNELKIALLRKSPFFAFALDQMRVEVIPDDDPRYVTVKGVGRLRIYRNVQKLDDKDFAFRVVKAIVHSLMAHGPRAKKMLRKFGDNEVNRYLARFAADVVAYRLMPQSLKARMKIDERWLDDIYLRLDWKTASFEELFAYFFEVVELDALILERVKEQIDDVDQFMDTDTGKDSQESEERGDGGDSGNEEDQDGEGKSDDGSSFGEDSRLPVEIDLDQMIDESERLLKKVAAMSMNFGRWAGTDESTGIRKLMEDVLREKPLPWNVILRRHLMGTYQRFFKTSWKRENRKVPELPGYERFGTRTVVAVDVSFSISDEEYSRFCKEVLEIAKRAGEVRLICWDTAAKDYGPVKSYSEMRRKKASGYGGTEITCLRPVLEKLRLTSNDVLIVLTDGRVNEDDNEVKRFMEELRAHKILVTDDWELPGFDKVIKMEVRRRW